MFDPPNQEHQILSLSENIIALSKKPEKIFDSNLIITGDVPCSMSALDLDTAICKIAKLIKIFNIGVDFMALQTQLKTLQKKQLILNNDRDSCAITIALEHPKALSHGGHNRFPLAFGLCESPQVSFSLTCQAVPVPSSLSSLQRGFK